MEKKLSIKEPEKILKQILWEEFLEQFKNSDQYSLNHPYLDFLLDNNKDSENEFWKYLITKNRRPEYVYGAWSWTCTSNRQLGQ